MYQQGGAKPASRESGPSRGAVTLVESRLARLGHASRDPFGLAYRMSSAMGRAREAAAIGGGSKGIARSIARGQPFGAERWVESIADLQRLPDMLRGRGYAESDVADIMHGNWIRFLRTAWSKT